MQNLDIADRCKLSFTLMVVGASGSGRKTFVNTLCNRTVVEESEHDDDYTNAHVEHPVQLKPVTVGMLIGIEEAD